jgi:hypothetical protein
MSEESLAKLGFALWLKKLGWGTDAAAKLAFSAEGNEIRRELDNAWGGEWRGQGQQADHRTRC